MICFLKMKFSTFVPLSMLCPLCMLLSSYTHTLLLGINKQRCKPDLST